MEQEDFSDGYRNLAADIIFGKVLDYMESESSTCHQDASNWFTASVFEMFCNGIEQDPVVMFENIRKRRMELYALVKTREGEEIKQWWRKHFMNYKIPRWTGVK